MLPLAGVGAPLALGEARALLGRFAKPVCSARLRQHPLPSPSPCEVLVLKPGSVGGRAGPWEEASAWVTSSVS